MRTIRIAWFIATHPIQILIALFAISLILRAFAQKLCESLLALLTLPFRAALSAVSARRRKAKRRK